jgi:hypothetical protein
MSDTEMRELDAWIDKVVFGNNPERRKAHWFCVTCEDEVPPNRISLYKCCNVCGTPADWRDSLPKYCTDPAASFELLKKCAEKLAPECGSVAIAWEQDIEEWTVQETDKYKCVRATANTLELAIALFAKNLYSK